LNDDSSYDFGDSRVYYLSNFIELNSIKICVNIQIILRALEYIHYLDYVFVIDDGYQTKLQELLGTYDDDISNDIKNKNEHVSLNIDELNDDG